MNNRRMNRNLQLPVAKVLKKASSEWKLIAQGKVRVASDRKISVDWKKFSQDKYLFVHSTIVSSVAVEDNGYHIKPPCDELVNTNGNAWSTPVLLATFRTFIDKPNFLEHVQIKSMSKGQLLDAVAKPVKYKGKNGKEADVVYVDILVAVDRKHTDIVRRIESGELNAMSMGATVSSVQCSKCGKIFKDTEEPCDHIKNELLTYFTDENGQNRIVAELCGQLVLDKDGTPLKDEEGNLIGDENSQEFIEASWVENPAFRGAVINHYISDVESKVASVMNLDHSKLQEAIDSIFKLRVADSYGMAMVRVMRDEIRKAKRESLINKVANEEIRKAAKFEDALVKNTSKVFQEAAGKAKKDGFSVNSIDVSTQEDKKLTSKFNQQIYKVIVSLNGIRNEDGDFITDKYFYAVLEALSGKPRPQDAKRLIADKINKAFGKLNNADRPLDPKYVKKGIEFVFYFGEWK